MTHEEVQREIPAYAASRLDGPARAAVEAHLGECAACSDQADEMKGLVNVLLQDGEELFEPHPEPQELRAFAQGEMRAGADRVARHLKICGSCDIQVDLCRRIPARATRAATSSPWIGAGRGALLAAAGIVLGLGLSAVIGGRDSQWSGPFHLPVLRLPARGQPPSTQVRVRPGQPQIVLAVPFQPLQGRPRDNHLRLQIRDAAGRSLYELHATVAEMTAQAEASGVIPLMFPSSRLPAGRYEVLIENEDEPRELLLRILFEVSLEE